MNYQRQYDLLIERARNREIQGYTERHHIVPRCMGGRDNKSNLVRLTPEEHFVAHQLLIKLFPDNFKLILSVKMMTISGNCMIRNNKLYGWLKRKISKSMSERIFTEETRIKMSVSAKKRKPISDETRKKMSIARTGNKNALGLRHSDETKMKIAAAGRRPCSEETKIKIGMANSLKKAKNDN